MNQEKINSFWKNFGEQPNRKLTVEDRNYIYGKQSRYVVTEQTGDLTTRYELRINRPNQDIGNKFKISFNSDNSVHFWISYSSGLIRTLTNRRLLFSDRQVSFKMNSFAKKLTRIYSSFKITSNSELTFQTEDIELTIEQIEQTKKLLIEIERASR